MTEEYTDSEKAEIRMEMRVNNYRARMLMDKLGVKVDPRVAAAKEQHRNDDACN